MQRDRTPLRASARTQTQIRVGPAGDLVEWDGTPPYPLALLPLDTQHRIAEEVAQPTPPPRWRDFELCQMQSRGWYEWYRQRGIDPDRIRQKIPAWMRAAVIERDGYVCQLCGGDVEPTDVHLDHRYPHALGGLDTPGNLQVAHSRCNMRKGARV